MTGKQKQKEQKPTATITHPIGLTGAFLDNPVHIFDLDNPDNHAVSKRPGVKSLHTLTGILTAGIRAALEHEVHSGRSFVPARPYLLLDEDIEYTGRVADHIWLPMSFMHNSGVIGGIFVKGWRARTL